MGASTESYPRSRGAIANWVGRAARRRIAKCPWPCRLHVEWSGFETKGPRQIGSQTNGCTTKGREKQSSAKAYGTNRQSFVSVRPEAGSGKGHQWTRRIFDTDCEAPNKNSGIRRKKRRTTNEGSRPNVPETIAGHARREGGISTSSSESSGTTSWIQRNHVDYGKANRSIWLSSWKGVTIQLAWCRRLTSRRDRYVEVRTRWSEEKDRRFEPAGRKDAFWIFSFDERGAQSCFAWKSYGSQNNPRFTRATQDSSRDGVDHFEVSAGGFYSAWSCCPEREGRWLWWPRDWRRIDATRTSPGG